MSTTDGAKILIRRLPSWYDGSRHRVRGNLIFEEGKQGTVGQIEDVGARLEDLPSLCGGTAGFGFLDTAGSVASILNLGVSVIGFTHVSKLLKRIEHRLKGIEAKLDDLTALVGVVDQKVDQLVELNEAQTAALADVHKLIVSFEVAKAHAALETLDILSGIAKTPERDLRIRDAAETLQVLRIWLVDKRDSMAASHATTPARTELLRAEVAVTLAECRARCFAGDASFAGSVLDRAIAGGRTEIQRMYDQVETHCLVNEWYGPVDAEAMPFDPVDAVEALAWLKGINLAEAEIDLASARKLAAVRRRAAAAPGRAAGRPASPRPHPWPAPERHGAEKAAAASLIASCRLIRDLEAAHVMCAVMERCGEPIVALLSDDRPASAPALVLDWTGGR